MNTKEAIEFIRLKIVPPKWDEEKYKGLKRVIELLQRGEKYEALYKEIKENVLNCEYCENIEINKIEQKYFPKESNNVSK